MAEKDNNGALVHFFIEPVEMRAKSEEAGRPIYEDREHLRIAFPTDTRTEIVRIAEKDDRYRYPEAYAEFQKEQKRASTGTPVEEWARLSKSQAKELKAIDIDTVEKLANLGEVGREHLGPDLREIVQEARAFLAQAKGSAEVQHFAAENERLKDDNERLKDDLKKSAAEVKRLTAELDKASKKAA